MSLAGAVGAMSLGCSVGDIMAISGLAVKVYSAYKDAPGDYRNISDEVKSLDIIINNAAEHFKSTALSDNKRREGQEVLRGCQNVLEDLDALIVKYNSLASASTSQVLQRIKLGTEDIATLRARLTSNTTLLNGFIQSCESDKLHARLDSVLGLHRTMSKDSIVSFAGSANTKKAYKKFCKGLFNIGVTAEMISQKEKEIQDIFKPQNLATSSQMDDSTFVDLSQLLEVRNSSDRNQLPEVGSSSEVESTSDAETSQMSAMSTETPRPRSRFGWIRPPIDFLVGPLMLTAAEAGNTKRLISTLQYVRNINFVDDQKETALHKAAARGHKDVVQLLLSKGASTEVMDVFNSTPLHNAAWNGYTGIVELLLSKGASIEAMDESYRTPLHDAVYNAETSPVELPLTNGASGASGASIEILNNFTSLHRAGRWDNARTVELLLSKGASVEAVDEFNNTPLHAAASRGLNSIVELLLSKGASVEAMDKSNRTPLHNAASTGDTNTVELLLSKGASVEAMDQSNRTPLHDAASSGDTSTVELLLSKGASIAVRDKNNKTPLDLATLNGRTDVMELLRNKAAKPVSPGNIQPHLDRGGSTGYTILDQNSKDRGSTGWNPGAG